MNWVITWKLLFSWKDKYFVEGNENFVRKAAGGDFFAPIPLSRGNPGVRPANNFIFINWWTNLKVGGCIFQYIDQSKIYERCLYDQIYSYSDKIFSGYQCGFRKDISIQHILLTVIEKMKLSRDNKQFCAAILTDLSKAFDCIPYDLPIAMLNAYGFDQEALKLIDS